MRIAIGWIGPPRRYGGEFRRRIETVVGVGKRAGGNAGRGLGVVDDAGIGKTCLGGGSGADLHDLDDLWIEGGEFYAQAFFGGLAVDPGLDGVAAHQHGGDRLHGADAAGEGKSDEDRRDDRDGDHVTVGAEISAGDARSLRCFCFCVR